MAKLLLKFRDQIIDEISLSDTPITIGRTEDNEVVLDNLAVSRNHARIFKQGDDFFVEDLGSQNGTCVNSQDIEKPHKLENKDAIAIGKHSLVFLSKGSDIEMLSGVRALRQKIGPLKPPSKKFLPPEETLRLGEESGQKSDTEKLRKENFGRVEIIEGKQASQQLEFDKLLILAGRGEKADIQIDGDYESDIVFVISNRPTGFFISPAKEIELLVDEQKVVEAIKLRNGSTIQAGATKMKFFTR